MPSQPKIQFIELAKWMRENGHTDRSFAQLAGIDKMTVVRLRLGTFKRIEPGWVGRVTRATMGAIGKRQFNALLARHVVQRAPKESAA